NFVRGEDSFVRAQRAAKPLIWHIYHQEEEAHLVKLDAFLNRYTQQLPTPLAERVRDLWVGWNKGADIGAIWKKALGDYSSWAQHCRQWCEQLNSSADLAAKLVHFCQKTL